MFELIKGKSTTKDYKYVDKNINLDVTENSENLKQKGIDSALAYCEKRSDSKFLRSLVTGCIISFVAGIIICSFFNFIVLKP